MKKRSVSSHVGGRGTTNASSTRKASRSTHKADATITTEEFDRLADLPVDDPEGDLTPYLDLDHIRRPGREVQRVNVDFPVDMLAAIDREAARLGVARQAFIKIRIADALRALVVK